MRMHGNYFCDIAEMQASRVLAADDGDEEEDDEEENEERRHDDEEEEDEEEEEETVWTSSKFLPVGGLNVSRREVRS